MLTNASITAWQQVSGSDSYGQPTRTDSSENLSGGIAALVEPRRTRLERNGRTVVASLQVHARRDPGFGLGDKITVAGPGSASRTVEILDLAPCVHSTLGHVTLACQ